MIVDDHALFRRGLEMVLQDEDDLMLVGEASDGEEAVEKAQELMPDVVLMDVRMPKRSGIEAAGHIKDLLHAKILMLTISDDEGDLYDAIKAGAAGYLLKEIPIEEVADAIRSVWAGQSRISPSMASKLLTEFGCDLQGGRRAAADAGAQADGPRDGGAPSRGAGPEQPRHRQAALHLREHGQEPHPEHPREAHLHSRMEAVVYAVREKMIEIT